MEDKTPLTAEEMIENFKRWFQQFMGGYAEIAITDYKNVVAAEVAQQTASLQERVKELEEDNKKLQEESNRWHQKYFKHVHYDHAHVQQLNEKLTGLLKHLHDMYTWSKGHSESDRAIQWQSFLKDHGLTE